MIEKTIFFITNDVDDIHVDFLNNVEFVKKQNPTYNVELYDFKRFEEYYKKINLEHYEKYYCKLNKNLGAMIADYIRYVLIYYQGGVYMDIKSRPKMKLENWINNNKNHVLFRWTTKAHDEILIGFLSSKKNNEMFREMIDVIHYKIDNYNNNNINIKNTRINILNFSGPRIFTKVWEKHALEVNDNYHQYLIRVAIKDYKNKYNIPHYSKVFEHLVVNQ
tara:strand:+ start:232 stop:891 length:660 start_codon:yes stop_codon:yes gene_type:complete